MDLKERMKRRGTPSGLADARLIWRRQGHPAIILSTYISPDGKRALSGGEDNTVWLWDLASARCAGRLSGHRERVQSVAIGPDGRWGLSGSWDGTLRMWDLTTGQCLRTLPGHSDWVFSAAIAPDGRFALSGGFDGKLHLWDVTSGECRRTLDGHTEVANAVAFGPDGRWALSGGAGEGGLLRVWDLGSGRCLRSFGAVDEDSEVTSLSLSGDGQYALSGGTSGAIRLWDVSSGRALARFIEDSPGSIVCSIAFTPDGRRALSSSARRSGGFCLWDLSTGQCENITLGDEGPVSALSISQDGQFVLAGTVEGELHLWKLDWREEIPEVEGDDTGFVIRPYLEIFLTLRCATGEDGVTRLGKPAWHEGKFGGLRGYLDRHGFGWLSSDRVRTELNAVLAEWAEPPPLPGPS